MHVIKGEMDHFEEEEKIWQKYKDFLNVRSGSGFSTIILDSDPDLDPQHRKANCAFFPVLGNRSFPHPRVNRIGAVTLMAFFSSGEECFLVYKLCWL